MTHEKTISDLAYHLWRARGCPEGSADLDWAEAERQVRGTLSGSTDRAFEAPVTAASPAPTGNASKNPRVGGDGAVDTPAPRSKKKAKR